MIPPDQSGFELLEQALKAGVRISFRRSIPSQFATVMGAPLFTWFLWKFSGFEHPFFWLLIATWRVFWYFQLLSPFRIRMEGSLVSVTWWYRRLEVARRSVSLATNTSVMSRLFGYDLLVLEGLGKFPIWPAYFIVTQHAEKEDGSRRD